MVLIKLLTLLTTLIAVGSNIESTTEMNTINNMEVVVNETVSSNVLTETETQWKNQNIVNPDGSSYIVNYYDCNRNLIQSDKVIMGTDMTYVPLDGTEYANGWNWYWTNENGDMIDINETISFARYNEEFNFYLQVEALGYVDIVDNLIIEPIVEPVGGSYVINYYDNNKILIQSDKVTIGTGIEYIPLSGKEYANGWDWYWTNENGEVVDINETISLARYNEKFDFYLQVEALGYNDISLNENISRIN